MNGITAEEHCSGDVQNLLSRCSEHGVVLKVLQHGVLFWQAGVDVLGIDSDRASESPLHFAGQRLERIDDRSQERRLSLAIVTDDDRSRSVIDLDVDAAGDLAFGISDRQIFAPHGGALSWFDNRGKDVGRRLLRGDIGELQSFKLLGFRPSLRGGAGALCFWR